MGIKLSRVKRFGFTNMDPPYICVSILKPMIKICSIFDRHQIVSFNKLIHNRTIVNVLNYFLY